MSADIITLPVVRVEREPPDGNGAREAVASALAMCMQPMGDVFTDDLLARLWLLGFKIVPLDGSEG